ncbi:MAG TPA: Ppx/GppA phosphatase family protein [Caulobacteraceae bacterium]|jgi:exopolyphosphatase/guanosine-5'-triphosphate,3'-diphosphate pyrophosphatase|nr:Ppx/GppA phosphatase family protein [Caulobacteraceae bacterium]
MSPPNDNHSRDAAVIDIGSNSVRLVVYRLEGRAIWTMFNEKVLAGLGRDVARTGRLAPEGVAATLTTLKRFRAVLDAFDGAQVFVVATAAVREAADGPAFVAAVKAETGFEVRVLSGVEEARYSAFGVLAGSPHANGVVGDLGGSSLELTRVANGEAHEGLSLPLGPFAFRGAEGFDPIRARGRTTKILEQIDDDFAARTFYAVGGGWRNLALLHMRIADYPLQIVHQYEIAAADALDAARFIARQSKGSLERIPGVSKRRLETIPYAAIVLESLIGRLGVERVRMSAYGLREGLLFEAMEPEIRALDPLIEGCGAMGAREGSDPELGSALEAWLTPVFSKLTPLFDGRDLKFVSAACRLADLGARLHPDHRADLVFEQVLRAPISGITHPERAFLAAALFARHTASAPMPDGELLSRILSDDRLHRARALGAAIRLGCDLSGRSSRLLGKSRLEIQGAAIRLSADDRWADMLLGEQTSKRASTLADQLGLGLKIGGR